MKKFYDKLMFCIQMRHVFSAAMILSILLSGCAAVQYAQPALPAVARSAEVSVYNVTGSEMLQAARQPETFVMVKDGKFVYSFLTDSGRVFAFKFTTWQAKGLFCGFDRSCAMESQFIRDGWKFVATGAPAIITKLLSGPLPTIMLMPASSVNSLDAVMYPAPVQD
jgi:hypothetical protein